MKQYVELVKDILANGSDVMDRTGVGTRSVFGRQLQFDQRERFPLVTVKETRWRVAFMEMLWFLRGESHTNWLREHNIRLWDDWADEHGNLGPIYGVQWRRWPSSDGGEIDQITQLIDGIRNNPTGRRHIVTAWNPADLTKMALPPCHRSFQCYSSSGGAFGPTLDLQLDLRSSDVALGLPFNIAQYAMLQRLLARATGHVAGRLIVNLGDAHLYANHLEAMAEVVDRPPIKDEAKLTITTNNFDIDGYSPTDFQVTGYKYHPFVKLPIAV